MAPTTRSKSAKKPNPSSNVPSASKSRVQKKSQDKPRIDKGKVAKLVRKTDATVKDPVNSNKQGIDRAPPVPTSSRASKNLLLDLPAELRNEVYGYVLEGYSFAMGDQGIAYKISIPPGPGSAADRSKSARLQKKHFLALLFTCRQVRAEAHRISYATCTFAFPYPDTLIKWTHRRTPQQQGCITSLMFQFEKWDQDPHSWGYFDEDEGTWTMRPTLHEPLDIFCGLNKIEIEASTGGIFLGHEKRLRAAREEFREQHPRLKVAVEFCRCFFVRSNVTGRISISEKRQLYIGFDE